MQPATYFCPNCAWEGDEPVCAVCGEKTESLEVDPTTGKTAEEETLPLAGLDEFEDWEGGEDDHNAY